MSLVLIEADAVGRRHRNALKKPFAHSINQICATSEKMLKTLRGAAAIGRGVMPLGENRKPRKVAKMEKPRRWKSREDRKAVKIESREIERMR